MKAKARAGSSNVVQMNPLYSSDYKFRSVYTLPVTDEDEAFVPEKAVSGLQGWIGFFEKAELCGFLFRGDISDAGKTVGKTEEQQEACEFDRTL